MGTKITRSQAVFHNYSSETDWDVRLIEIFLLTSLLNGQAGKAPQFGC